MDTDRLEANYDRGAFDSFPTLSLAEALIAAVIDDRRGQSSYVFREEHWVGKKVPKWAVDTLRCAFASESSSRTPPVFDCYCAGGCDARGAGPLMFRYFRGDGTFATCESVPESEVPDRLELLRRLGYLRRDPPLPIIDGTLAT